MSSFVRNIVILLQLFNVFCEDLPEWREKYYYQATKTHLTSGIIEKIDYWRTNDSSRKDTYNGATKTIIKEGEDSYGVKYEIHPETTNEYTNKLFCSITKGDDSYDKIEVTEDLLPSVDDTYTHIGSDTLEIGDVKKFKSVYDDSLNKKVTTLWAKYENSSWFPARVEILVFGKFRENLQKHIVIDIINFNTTFSDEVFDTNKYNCTEKAKVEYNTFEADNNEINLDDTEHVGNIFTELELPPKEMELYLLRVATYQLYRVGLSSEDEEPALYIRFLAKQKVQYDDQREGKMRRKIFEENMRRILAHNNRKSNYKLGINKFIDRTPSELDNLLSLFPSSEQDPGTIPFPHDLRSLKTMKFPKQFDLRLKGWITPVQDQLECKAGWAISVAGVVAAAHAAKTEGPLMHLSSQAILDCAWGYQGRGCAGGNDTSAYMWAQTKGIPPEVTYGPYANQNGYCATKKFSKAIKIQGYTAIPPRSIEGIKYALKNHGPVTTAIAVPYDLKYYTGGIFYSTSCDRDARKGNLKLDHLVTVVGYGRHLGEDYWIIKNSWGKDWGVDGYFFMSMRNDNCGVTFRPMYAVA